MAKSSFSEFSSKSLKDLVTDLKNSVKNLISLRSNFAGGSASKPHELRSLRKKIARTKTAISSKIKKS